MSESIFTYPSPLPLNPQPVVSVTPGKDKHKYLYWCCSISPSDGTLLQSLPSYQTFLRECNIVEPPRAFHITNWFHGFVNPTTVSSYEREVMKQFENLKYAYDAKSRGPIKIRVLKVIAFPGYIAAARVQIFEGTATVSSSDCHHQATSGSPNMHPPISCELVDSCAQGENMETIETYTPAPAPNECPLRASDNERVKGQEAHDGLSSATTTHQRVYDGAFSLDYLVTNLCPHMTLNTNYNSRGGSITNIKASNSNELLVAEALEALFGPLRTAVDDAIKEATLLTKEQPTGKVKNNDLKGEMANNITSQQLSDYINLIMKDDTAPRNGGGALPAMKDYVDSSSINPNLPLIRKSHPKDWWYPGYYTIDTKKKKINQDYLQWVSVFQPKLNIELIVRFRLEGMKVWVPTEEITLSIDGILHC